MLLFIKNKNIYKKNIKNKKLFIETGLQNYQILFIN